jgi:3-deoxy-7-phosphoheptulonate synthase
MVDCSHANSGKDPSRQPLVWKSIAEQRASGRREIIGAMLESNINFGGQSLGNDPQALQYGVSITDSCIDWETTERLVSRSQA